MGDNRTEELIGPPRLTRFEIARIVGARALQLALGAPPLVDVSKAPAKDPVAIALLELEEGVLPITIYRMRADGTFQKTPLKKLLPGSRKYIQRTLKSWNLH